MEKFRDTVEMSALGGILDSTRSSVAKWRQERVARTVATLMQ